MYSFVCAEIGRCFNGGFVNVQCLRLTMNKGFVNLTPLTMAAVREDNVGNNV